MSIIKRSKRTTPFVQIDRTALQNKAISWKAKGLLGYLLSLPDDWQVYASELKNHATDGRDSTAGALRELIKAGYVMREKKRSEAGQFEGYEYTVFDTPQTENPQTENPQTENPSTENPISDKPFSENPQLQYKEDTNKHNTEETLEHNGDSKESPPPTPEKDLNQVDLKNNSEAGAEEKKKKVALKKKKDASEAKYYNETIEVLNWFIDETGVEFRPPAAKAKMEAYGPYKLVKKWIDKFTVEQMIEVFRFKKSKWWSELNMMSYVRIETLLSMKFEKYRNEMLMSQRNSPNGQLRPIANAYSDTSKFKKYQS